MEGLSVNVVHYPSLKTILAIEDVVKNAGAALSRNQILARLPTKVMRSTLNLALAYMGKRGLVTETEKGFIWIFKSNGAGQGFSTSERVSIANDIGKIKRDAVPILKANRVKRAAIFGSVARGEAKATSDVDFLLEFKGKVTLFDLGGLKADLEEKLKRSVDLILFRSIDPRLRDRILGERVDIL